MLEEKDEDVQPSPVLCDDDRDTFWAIGVESKSVTEAFVKYVKGVLDQTGYRGHEAVFFICV